MKYWNEPVLWGALDEVHKMYFSFPEEGKKYNSILIFKHFAIFSTFSGFYFFGIFGFIVNAYSGEEFIQILL